MRFRAIDIFKGILTIQMILAHCIQFFIALNPNIWQYSLSEYINLTTFSGFMLAFGFVAWSVYINKPSNIYPKILKNVLRMLLAYYISAFAFRVFIEKIPLGTSEILDLLLLRSLAGWSEFLLSFAALMLLISCLQPLMHKSGKYLPLIIALVSVAACIIPLPTENPIVATFIGQSSFAVFAVIPYCLYFAVGIFVAQNKGKIPLMLVVPLILGTCIFFAALFMNGLPSRFPLSLPWLLGALGFVYIYYQASHWLSQFKPIAFIEDIGKNSLFYLLLSNVLIFAIKSSRFYKLDTFYAFATFIFIMAIIYYLRSIIRNPPRV